MAAEDSPQMFGVMALVLGTIFIAIPAAIIWTVKKVGTDDDDRSTNPDPRDRDLVGKLEF